MNKIIDYLRTLLPTFAKDEVLEDVRVTREELKNQTILLYIAAAESFKDWDFKDPTVQANVASFSRLAKTGSKRFLPAVEEGLEVLLTNLAYVEDRIAETYQEEVAGRSLTYVKANLLQFVELSAFVTRYARRYLSAIYARETAALPQSEVALDEALTPAELKWLDDNFVAFATAFRVVTVPTSDLKRVIAAIPDIVVTSENAGTLQSTMGAAKITPFQVSLESVFTSPIYHVAMMVAEWQVNRFKAAQEEARLVELRKLNLERLVRNKPDAKIQREIDYLQSRVEGLNYKLKKMERDYA
jgi:hypothetical protein